MNVSDTPLARADALQAELLNEKEQLSIALACKRIAEKEVTSLDKWVATLREKRDALLAERDALRAERDALKRQVEAIIRVACGACPPKVICQPTKQNSATATCRICWREWAEAEARKGVAK